MVWTTPRTWVAAETVSASIMNTHVRDNLNLLKTSVNDDGTISHETLDVSILSGGNTGTGEDIIATKTLTGGTLTTGNAVRARAFGMFAATTELKQVRMRVGGSTGTNTAISSNLAIYNNLAWSIETVLIRGASTKAIGTFVAQVAAAGELLVTYTTPTENFSNDQDIIVTGEAVSNNDIVCHGMLIEVLRS